MGLLDSLAGQVAGSLGGAGGSAPAHGGLMDVLAQMLGNTQGGVGGLPGLVNAFQANGMGDVIQSWIGTGQNLPITADQIGKVLGSGQLQALAQQLGFSPQDLSGQLANLLPQAVDRMTPGGTLPQGDALGQAIGMLGGLFK